VISGPDQPDELPVACTLGAGDFETRRSELTALGRRSLISVDRSKTGPVVLSFKSDTETRSELERIVHAEAECCAFLQMTITVRDSLKLTIDGPDDAGPVIDELVGAFAAEAAA
jgi:hypothetical protein